MEKVKETNAGNLDRHGHGLKESGGRKVSVELLSGVGYSCLERTPDGATRTRNLSDHGGAVLILHDDMVVDVVLQFIEGHRGPDHIDRILRRAKASVGGRCCGRSN